MVEKQEDPWGKLTSFQWNGSAIVDYVPIDFYNDITSLKVGDYSPWVSDHCPLHFEMILRTTFKEDRRETIGELPKVFHLNLEDRTKFVETLKPSDITQKIASISSSVNIGAEELTTKITDLLIETCDKAGIKPKKTNHRGKSTESCLIKNVKNLKIP